MAGPTQTDLRQTVLRSALSMIGSAAGATTDTILPLIDAEIAKLFEDRNVLLSQGGSITFTGTQVQFTENLNLVVHSHVAGGAPTIISLGSASQTFNAGDMWYAVLNRSAGTATTAIATAAAGLPVVTSANQEVFLIATRIDAGDGTQRLYFRNGMALNAGQTVRLGASGSGSGGSGTGDDLDALQFRASFTDVFGESPSNANSSINGAAGNTNAVFSAAKSLYAISYDASKTVTTTGTSATLSAAATYTVAVGDVLISGGYVRKITAVTSQTAFTLEAAFPSNLSAAACTVSQAVYSKDIYNLAVDGAAISAAFNSSSFSEILVDYKDNATANSNLFTPNTTPYVGFVASPDNTNFTTVQKRATNETDTVGSTLLPSAGTSLYLRFFSNATTGSGTVNLLTYKAFMQKSVAASAGGVFNAAYAFTNGVGTPVNASLAVTGGKTTVTLTFPYAVGVNSGLPYGSLDVYLNGQLIPRFINATLTPDASYTEVSATVIQLDRDYSAQNLSLEILQRVQIIDASTTNTTQISALQEITQNGFQSFVATNKSLSATTTAGTPSAGSFYSSVVNRAPIVDISQDLKASFGIERIQTQQIVQLQNEFGPNGEPVWAAVNDDRGLIRFVGSGWTSLDDTQGLHVRSPNVNDYVEITFYGTGLNLMHLVDPSARGYYASVDGGAESSTNIYSTGTSGSGVLVSRNYSQNIVATVVSGLALGVHTVKIRIAATDLHLYGFEVINANSATNVTVNPGVGYVNGLKLVGSATQTFAYNAPVTGTKGGRVVTYLGANGTVGQAFQAVNTSTGSLSTSVDHSLEEIVRTYNFREFGAGRNAASGTPDDFSAPISSAGNYAFTLDDGITTLAGNQVVVSNFGGTNIPAVVLATNSTSYLTLTFVGTGLDVLWVNDNASGTNNTSNAFTVQVDGGTAQNWPTTGTSGVKLWVKIASGLPYGTHTVKFFRNAPNVWSLGLASFVVYQPKKPSLPAGALELADYNVLATFAANSTAALETVSTGVLRKELSVREATYVEGTGGTTSWTTTGVSVTAAMGGFETNSDRSGAYIEYTFFGTGFDLRYYASSNRSQNISVTVDGLALTTTNFSGLTTSTYGGGSFSAGTLSQYSATAVNGAGFVASGLPLGLHKVRFTNNTASVFLVMEAFDVITPIHSAKSNLIFDLQNTLPVGSQAVSDNRQTSPIKDTLPAKKAVAQATGVSSSPSTGSTSFVPVPDMSVTIKTSQAGSLKISYSISTYMNSGTSPTTYYQVYVDGVQVGTNKIFAFTTNGFTTTVSDSLVVPVSAGAHKVDLYWLTNAGVLVANGTARNLLVEEK